VFTTLLEPTDAVRATAVMSALIASGLDAALTGGLAIDAHLAFQGRPTGRRPLNDLDFVVERFDAIPPSLGGRFLVNHIHPHAPAGKMLVQFVDREHALRVDLFRAFGETLSRAVTLDSQAGPLDLVSLEDLVARTTAYVGRLRGGRPVEAKHARAFARLQGLGDPQRLEDAWRDHRQDVPGCFADAARECARMLAAHPDLVVEDGPYDRIRSCDRCQEHGGFHLAPADDIVAILGYC
jgi:hypothetical protein